VGDLFAAEFLERSKIVLFHVSWGEELYVALGMVGEEGPRERRVFRTLASRQA